MPTYFRIPIDDPAQAVRARHLLLSAASYLSITCFVLYCSYSGLFRLPPSVVWGCVALAFGINGLFFVSIYKGWNKRLSDPSMTLLQMGVSLCWMMFVLYYIDQMRGAVLLLFLTIFLFGTFRLRRAQFVWTAVVALSGYAVVIGMLVHFRPSPIDLHVEMLQWMLLALVLPWFAVMGAYISNIRSALRQTNVQMKQALVTIEEMASHDELTGAYNRRFFLDALRREVARAERESRSLCLAILDLDYFKLINDRHGHLAGDQVLRAFAECVKTQVREFDTFARYGGEEFALLVVDANLEQASILVDRIRQRVASLATGATTEPVTVSIGVAQFRDGDTAHSLIGRADVALYAAKDSGRNRVVGAP